MTVQNTCLSGGGIEVFLEPVLPAPRVLVVGETPIATALLSLGPELGLDLVAVTGGSPEPLGSDLAVVVASHGRDELHILRRALDAGVPYVGLVASHRRGGGVLADLRADGVPDEQLAADRRARRARHRRAVPRRGRALDSRDDRRRQARQGRRRNE